MAVVLRLSRHGGKKNPFYRIVSTDKQKKRDGRYLEIIGTYNPMVNPSKVVLQKEKIEKWLAQGAKPTEIVRALIKKNIPGLIEGIEKGRLNKIQARRKARKTRVAAGGKAKPKKAAKAKK